MHFLELTGSLMLRSENTYAHMSSTPCNHLIMHLKKGIMLLTWSLGLSVYCDKMALLSNTLLSEVFLEREIAAQINQIGIRLSV